VIGVDRALSLGYLPTADVGRRRIGATTVEVVLCIDDNEMLAEADRIAAEHCRNLVPRAALVARPVSTITAQLFLGPETNVSYGDKVIGTNHTLPTKGAARYTPVGYGSASFLKDPAPTRRSIPQRRAS